MAYAYRDFEKETVRVRIEKSFGKISGDIRYEIHVTAPTPERYYYTLVTSGAGAYKMSLPEDIGDNTYRAQDARAGAENCVLPGGGTVAFYQLVPNL